MVRVEYEPWFERAIRNGQPQTAAHADSDRPLPDPDPATLRPANANPVPPPEVRDGRSSRDVVSVAESDAGAADSGMRDTGAGGVVCESRNGDADAGSEAVDG